ncbi:MAG: LPS-assembly protein LptD [Bacteroidales bacterium]|nr:LPS-assembly protein LptD [Bacteroidales bacterium]
MNLRNRYKGHILLAIVAMLAFAVDGYGMERSYLDTLRARINSMGRPLSRDTLLVKPDSAMAPAGSNDTLSVPHDTTAKDTLINNSSLDSPVFSGGRDSIVKDFNVDGRKMMYYYGDVKVSYGDIEISADYMAFDVDSKTVFAKGLPDTSGTVKGKPVMKQGGKQYEMESVYYNFNSEKAKIKNMITQEAEGFLHGQYIKKMPDNSINIAKGKYTTCDHEHPHFYLKMSTAKVINGGEKTVFGPAYVVLEDVPTPFALPFGFVPKFGGRASGLLMPTYGEEAARGFFMRGLGYYFVLSDHFDIAATGDIYSMGSWAGQLNARYNKRYKYNGTLSIAYQNDQTGEKGQPDFFQTKNFSMQWTHSMDSKARPGTTFRASVNFSSPSYNQYNNQTNIQTALQNQISSSISFGKTWAGTPFSLTINALHSQNSRDSSYAVTLPNLTFTVNRIYPFKRKERVGKEKFYESFAFNYSTTLENKMNFKASEVGKPDFFKKMKNGMRHNFSFGLPSFTIAKYIQGAPSINYGMNWYFTDCEKVFNQETQKLETIYSDPLSTFGITQNFSAGLSLSTRLYGKFVFGKDRKVEAIRHMVTPSITFSAQPDMGTSANGYTQMSYVDANGIQHVVNYNKYEGQINSPPGRGKSAAMSFSLGNNLEAKIRDKNDTTGTGTRKVKIIDQLAIGGSYNFLADSLNLSNISMNMNTTIFGKLGLNVNATFDPYAIDQYGKKINTFNIVKEGGFKLARLTNASASFSYSFSGEGKGRLGADYKDPNARSNNMGESTSQSQSSSYQRVYYNPMTGEYIPGGWVYYMNPNVPWSINTNFNYSYSRNYQYANEQLLTRHNHMMTLGLSGQIRLTDALNVNMNSGVDLMKMKLTTTQLSASYDLHCFSISVSWVPNGQWESWSFRINAKASALADLLQFKKNASYWDNRF